MTENDLELMNDINIADKKGTNYKSINLAHNFDCVPRTQDVKLLNEDATEKDNNNFEHLMLSQKTTQGLLRCGFNLLTPIQLKSIPIGRMGLDLILQSKAGTGKTCVFAVIALESLDITLNMPQIIVMVPTKEIAFQIKNAFTLIGQGFKGLQVACMVGGYKIQSVKETPPHIKKLYSSHIIVGTPSRIKHLIFLKMLSIQEVKLLVMDEVDQLFRVKNDEEIINWIYSILPKTKQVITTSATYSDDLIKLFHDKYMTDPQIIRIEKDNIQLIGVKQYIAYTNATVDDTSMSQNEPNKRPLSAHEEKLSLLKAFLLHVKFTRCFVFCNFNKDLQKIANVLMEVNISAKYLSSKQIIQNRLATLKEFRDDKFKVLITTDVMSRGIDVKDVDVVINFEVPLSPDKYMHRIGRCGRFGTFGVALTLISSPTDRFLFNNYATMYDLDVAILPKPLEESIPVDFVSNQAAYSEPSSDHDRQYMRDNRPDIREMAYQDYDLMPTLDLDLLKESPNSCTRNDALNDPWCEGELLNGSGSDGRLGDRDSMLILKDDVPKDVVCVSEMTSLSVNTDQIGCLDDKSDKSLDEYLNVVKVYDDEGRKIIRAKVKVDTHLPEQKIIAEPRSLVSYKDVPTNLNDLENYINIKPSRLTKCNNGKGINPKAKVNTEVVLNKVGNEGLKDIKVSCEVNINSVEISKAKGLVVVGNTLKGLINYDESNLSPTHFDKHTNKIGGRTSLEPIYNYYTSGVAENFCDKLHVIQMANKLSNSILVRSITAAVLMWRRTPIQSDPSGVDSQRVIAKSKINGAIEGQESPSQKSKTKAVSQKGERLPRTHINVERVITNSSLDEYVSAASKKSNFLRSSREKTSFLDRHTTANPHRSKFRSQIIPEAAQHDHGPRFGRTMPEIGSLNAKLDEASNRDNRRRKEGQPQSGINLLPPKRPQTLGNVQSFVTTFLAWDELLSKRHAGRTKPKRTRNCCQHCTSPDRGYARYWLDLPAPTFMFPNPLGHRR